MTLNIYTGIKPCLENDRFYFKLIKFRLNIIKYKNVFSVTSFEILNNILLHTDG